MAGVFARTAIGEVLALANGKITALEVQQKNHERINVFIENRFAFGLNAVEAARLQVGQFLTEAQVDHLKAKDSVTQATQTALYFLAPRPRSITEVRQRLLKKGFEDSVIEEVIEYLEKLNYLNDAEFARYWIDNRGEFNPRGGRALRYELQQKGVDSTLIEEALTELDLFQLALTAAEKKMRSLRGQDAQTVRTRLGGFLSRRGFDYDTVRAVVDRLVEEKETDDDYYDEE